ncbi:MAG: carbohydrate kinase [Chlamydiae bacterium]|nr:MAG: carbohydrate kinase [Chlamydiota bacterium]
MKRTIVGIGEILWDMLPSGRQLGGAPMNFTYWAKRLGGDAFMVSSIGDDELGEEILSRLKSINLDVKFVQRNDDGYPTGTVDVEIDDNGKPDYIIHENAAWDFIEWNDKLKQLAGIADAVCFGALAQRGEESKETIGKFFEITRKDCIKIFDINLRQHFYNTKIIEKSLAYATILKLNNEELPVVAEIFGLSGNNKDVIQKLIDKFNLELVALTRGANGSLLISKNEVSEHHGIKVNVIDTVGAGDSFSAAIVIGLLNGKSLMEINESANELAAKVCSNHGGTM